jgi:hypothetical protein
VADIPARTRLLIGSTSEWAASDLVLGLGELVVERADAVVKLKAGDGVTRYSGLPFVTAVPDVPLEYLTQTEGDARYLQLAGISVAPAANAVPRLDAMGLLASGMIPPLAYLTQTGADARYLQLSGIATTPTANAVPRLGAGGMLAAGMIPAPAAIDVSTGVADAGKLVKTASTGKLDQSLIAFAQDVALPDGKRLAWGDGSAYIQGSGATDALTVGGATLRLFGAASGVLGVREGGAYGGAAANAAYDTLVLESNGQSGISILSPNNVSTGIAFGDPESATQGWLQYDHATDTTYIGAAGASRLAVYAGSVRPLAQVQTPDGTAAAPAYAWLGSNGLGLYRPAADTLGFATASVEKMRLMPSTDAQLLVGLTVPLASVAGRGDIEINGATESTMTFGVGGMTAGILYANATEFRIGASTGGAVRFMTFRTGGAEKVHITESADAQLLVGMTAPINFATGRGYIGVNGGSSSIIDFCVGGALRAYLFEDTTNFSMMHNGAGSIYLGIGGAQKLQVSSTQLLDQINGGVELGWRDMPVSSVGGSITVDRGHRGRLLIVTGAAAAITLPGDSVFNAGEGFTIFNLSGGSITVVERVTGSRAYLRWNGITAGTRTLAANGTGRIFSIGGNTFVMTGELIS